MGHASPGGLGGVEGVVEQLLDHDAREVVGGAPRQLL